MKKGERMPEPQREQIRNAHQRRLADPRLREEARSQMNRARAFRKPPRYKGELEADRARRLRYRITPEQFERMWRDQDGRCALCAKPLGHGAGKHAIDHDHETGVVRALLCLSCNVGLGWFESFRNLAETYLSGHCAVKNCD